MSHRVVKWHHSKRAGRDETGISQSWLGESPDGAFEIWQGRPHDSGGDFVYELRCPDGTRVRSSLIKLAKRAAAEWKWSPAGMSDPEETDLKYLADIFGRRGQDWIIRAIGARSLVSSDVERKVRERRQHLDRWGRTTRTGVDEPLRQVIANYQTTLDELEQSAALRAVSPAIEAAPAIVEQLRRWIADLDIVLAKRRGQGLGAESKTFDLLDRQKLLKDVVALLTGQPVKGR